MKKLVCDEVKMAAMVFRALDHELRQKILQLLEQKTRLTVTDIYLPLAIEQSVCSSHLKILRDAGVLGVERAAKNRYYYIDHRRLEEINLHAKALVWTE